MAQQNPSPGPTLRQAWTKDGDFGPAAAVTQAVLEEFRRPGIELPLPQWELRGLNGGGVREGAGGLQPPSVD